MQGGTLSAQARVAAAVAVASWLSFISPAHAAQRTFVSTGGVDTNNCSLAAPCRGFAKAITVTDPGGELVVLDSGGYGAVTVNKNVTILSPSGVYAGISVFAATDGVTVAAPATKVALRGLTINGQGGNNGIRVQAGEVHVESTVVSNMGAAGILVEGGSTVRISGTVARSNADGLRVAPSAGAVSVLVRDSEFSTNATAGIGVSPTAAGSSALVTVERSSVTKNGAGVVTSPGASAAATVIVTQSVASENAGAGVSSAGSTATVFVRESAITRNGTGLLQSASGALNACGANLLVANAVPQSGAIGTSSCLDVASASGTVTSVGTGAGLTGGPITTSGTMNLAATNLLPTVACATNQIPQWSGSAWTCATIASGGGTVTSVGTGTGLTGGPITTTGTVAADTTYLQRRVSGSCAVGNYVRAIAADGTVTCGTDSSGPANAFVQGGNAFGATAVLGTTDGNAVEIAANGSRVMRYEPDATSPNVIGGSSQNYSVFSTGAAVGGGGAAGSQISGVLGGPRDCTNPPGFGCGNIVGDKFVTIAGGAGNRAGIHSISSDSSAFATVGGGLGNLVDGFSGTVAGGIYNTVANHYGSVGGGYGNNATGYTSTVAGGLSNTASGQGSSVPGGGGNNASGSYSTIGGGQSNIAQGDDGTVAGGSYNYANGASSTSTGGFANIASGDYATVPGGSHNQASGAGSFAAGEYAVVSHDNSFLWCDGHTTCNSQEAQDFIVVAQGGIKMYALTGGCTLTGAATQWVCYSDRDVKENFVEPDSAEVLRRVVGLPVTRWNEKGVPGIDHMGPMAQDFRAAFGLGADEKHIGSTDISGVALVAIKGLNAKLESAVAEKNARIEVLEQRVAELESLRGELASVKAALAEVREARALLAAH